MNQKYKKDKLSFKGKIRVSKEKARKLVKTTKSTTKNHNLTNQGGMDSL